MKNLTQKLGRTGALVLVVLLVFSVFGVRLFDWQILQGDYYRALATQQSTDFTKLPAARGQILDSEGQVLAGNRLTYSVNLVYQKMDLSEGFYPNPVLLKIVELLESRQEEWKDELPILIDGDGHYVFDEERPKEIEYMKSAAMLNVQSYATADDCMQALTERYNCGGYPQKMTRAIASLRYSMTKAGFGLSNSFTVAGDVSQETVGIINERLSEMPGLETDVAITRYYGEDGTLVPQVVGRVGAISEDQYNKQKEDGNIYDPSKGNVEAYTIDDRYGQSGLENAFESTLRGLNGKEVVNLDSDGSVLSSVVTQSPKSGNTVMTTLNSEVQKAANDALKEQIEAITDSDGTVTGAAVALDAKTFGVLASASYPTYDMNRYTTDSDYIQELSQDETYKPLFNKALFGTYAPGSIFKPLVAIAALEEGAIDLSTTFFCERIYTKFDYAGYIPACLGYHGYEDVYGALRDSCNIFFYETGDRLGIEKMDAYAEYFGLGEATGVETGESLGTMSNPAEYQEIHGAPWTEAITIQAAIGQADDSFTPVQLASYAATIANNGKRMRTHFLDKVMDYTGQTVVQQYEPKELYDAQISDTTMQAVKTGMRMAAESGTASNVFADYGIAIGAKTGTAETTDGPSDNITFIAFAPYDDPEIAVAVVLEHGAKGNGAKLVAKAMLDAYFGLDSTPDGPGMDGETATPTPSPTPTPSVQPEDGANLRPGAFYKPEQDVPPAPSTADSPSPEEDGTGDNSSGAADEPPGTEEPQEQTE